jgi:hypothetical protein
MPLYQVIYLPLGQAKLDGGFVGFTLAYFFLCCKRTNHIGSMLCFRPSPL